MRTHEQYKDAFDNIVDTIVTWYIIDTGEVFGMDDLGHEWYAWNFNGTLINKQKL